MVCRPGTNASAELNAMVARSFNVVLERGAAAIDDTSRVVDCHTRAVYDGSAAAGLVNVTEARLAKGESVIQCQYSSKRAQ
jgi:hypothetical protein